MQKEELPQVRLTDAGYSCQWELMCDLFVWLDLRLYFYYAHHQWIGPLHELKNMMGLVVTQEEFEHQMTKAAQHGLEEQLDETESAQIQDATTAIRRRLGRTPKEIKNTVFPLLALCRRCELDDFEQDCVILSYAATLDHKYEKMLAYLQDDITRKYPGTALATQLFLPADGNIEQYLSRFSVKDRFTALFEPEELEQGNLALRPLVLFYLSTGIVQEQTWLTVFDGAVQQPEQPLLVQKEVVRQLERVLAEPETCIVCLSGGAGSGKRFQLEHLFSRRKLRGVFADLSGEHWKSRAEYAALAACLSDAYLCLYHLDRKNEAGELTRVSQEMTDILCALETNQKQVFFLSALPIQTHMPRLTLDFELPPLSEGERLLLFRRGLKRVKLEDGITPEELSAKFRFSPRQIQLACRQAAGLAKMNKDKILDSGQLHAACYRQVVHKLDELAHRVPPAYTWDDVILPAPQKRLMQQACGHIRYQYRVYQEWGFDQKISYGRGLSVLFAGAPGTGKTMCAQVMARQLNMEIYKINISQVVSKYIGETEKNLQAVFSEAKNSNCILFFDECDALFGKRSEVKDAHDRNANVEVAYLLQQIEEYDGVCILATNLIGNIDEAFMRRMTYVVHFPFPDAAMRKAIYRRMMPDTAPLEDDIDWDFLAGKFELSGGHIKNIVLSAAFLSAGGGGKIGMQELLRAAVGEMKKNGMVVVREELREYADILEEEEEEETREGRRDG